MVEAAHAWRLLHPGATLKFNGIAPYCSAIAGNLDVHWVSVIAGNAETRDLLATIEAVAPHGATFTDAESVIAEVFRVQNAFRWPTTALG